MLKQECKQGRTGQGKAGQDRTGQDRTGQGQDRTGQGRDGTRARQYFDQINENLLIVYLRECVQRHDI